MFFLRTENRYGELHQSINVGKHLVSDIFIQCRDNTKKIFVMGEFHGN